LRKIHGNVLEQKAVKVSNIAAAVKLMQETVEECDYSYAWNNFTLRGQSFGKGIVYLEKHLDITRPEGFFEYKNKKKLPEELIINATDIQKIAF